MHLGGLSKLYRANRSGFAGIDDQNKVLVEEGGAQKAIEIEELNEEELTKLAKEIKEKESAREKEKAAKAKASGASPQVPS